MSDIDPTDTPDNTPDDGAGDDKNLFKAITSQDDFDAAIAKRLAREAKKYEGFEDFKAKAAKFDANELEQGSEIEKLTRKAEKAEREKGELAAKVAKAERLDLVREIADELGLPKKLISRIQGDSEDDIRADIKDLVEGLPKAVAPKADDESPKGPPSRTPKPKMTFSGTGDESDEGLNQSADDILKDIPRGGGQR